MTKIKPQIIQIIGLVTLVFMIGMILVLKKFASWQAEKDGFRLNLEIGYLSNISQNAPVKLSGGIQVGYVEKIFQKDLKTYIRVFLNETMKNKIPRNEKTIFAIYSESLMGPKYINLSLPMLTKKDVFLKDNDTWLAIEPASVDKMMKSFSRWFNIGKNNKHNSPYFLLKEFKRFLASYQNISKENKANLMETIKNANLTLSKVGTTVSNLRKKIKKISKQYNIDSAENKQNFALLLKETDKVVAHAKVIQKSIEKSRGSLGKWINKKEFYNYLTQTTTGAKKLLICFKKRPYILFEKKPCRDF